MLATFVIGLREGLEAALIVSIIASFLRQRGRSDLLGRVWSGVVLAVLLCLGVAVGLQLLSAQLPQQQQEGLETLVGLAAVVMVTSMIAWMQRHARSMKGELQAAAESAVARGSAWALVGMACLAVLREGLETAVFLLATFQASQDALLASVGAVAGLACAVLIGFGLYRGAVHLDLARFFRATSFLLVLVAAGLVLTCLHTAHEAGWLNVGQTPLLNLTWLVRPGSVQAAILTGMLGLQPQPTQIEVAGWLVYVLVTVPLLLWRPGRAARAKAQSLDGSSMRVPS